MRRDSSKWAKAMVAALAATSVALSGCSRPLKQPVAFSHRLHVYNNVPCLVCHPSAESGQGAGLPSVAVCRRCHEDVLYESPEEVKIRTAVETGSGLAWKAVYALRPYVYFSHRRHVKVGEIACDRCHGDVEHRNVPFDAAVSPFGARPGMNACLACHRASQSRYAGQDCIQCHR
jgi:hypothetical protein